MKEVPKQKSKKLIYILVGVLALLIAAAVWKSQQKTKGDEVTEEAVQRRTIKELVTASGKIYPETEVKISADVSGEIVELYVKEGDSVTIGQILGKIKPDEYASAVERGEASVKSAEAQREISTSNVSGSNAQIEQLKADLIRVASQLATSKTAHSRSEQLLKEGVISQSDFDNTYNALKGAEAGLSAAEANLRAAQSSFSSAQQNVRVSDYGITSARATLKELRTSLSKTNIVAPVSGIVSKLNLEKGERVVGTLQMAGTEIMRVANLRSMEVQVEVSENDILKVGIGNDADIEVDAYLGRKFKGKVTEIASSASNISSNSAALNTDQVTNFIIKVRIDAASYQDLMRGKRYPFFPGMSASVDINTKSSENILTVPLIAVTVREDEKDKKNEKTGGAKAIPQEMVFLIKNDSVSLQPVKTGIQDNDYIEIVSGLQEGEKLVSGPYSAIARKLKQGAKIVVVDAEKLKKEEKSND
jgi:HlyD family secretion protein